MRPPKLKDVDFDGWNLLSDAGKEHVRKLEEFRKPEVSAIRPRWIVYRSAIGSLGPHNPERSEYRIHTEALREFRASCSPVLYIEAFLLYVGPNPAFPGRVMQSVLKHWHMREDTRK